MSQAPIPGLIDPFILSMIAAQLYPSIESWGEKDQAEGAVDAAARIFVRAREKAQELNRGALPPAQDGGQDRMGGGPVYAAFGPPR